MEAKIEAINKRRNGGIGTSDLKVALKIGSPSSIVIYGGATLEEALQRASVEVGSGGLHGHYIRRDLLSFPRGEAWYWLAVDVWKRLPDGSFTPIAP